MLLSRPWQYDNQATHHGRENTYSFNWNNKKIVLMPLGEKIDKISNKGKTLVVLPISEKELQMEVKSRTTILI